MARLAQSATGALAAQPLGVVRGDRLVVRAVSGTVRIDALLVRPLAQRVRFGTAVELVVNTLGEPRRTTVEAGTTVERFRRDGTPAGGTAGRRRIVLPAGGFAVAR